MTKEEVEFFRKSFDRIELILTRILEASQKKQPRQPRQVANAEPGATKLANIWNEWKAIDFPVVVGISPGSARHKNAVARWSEKPDEEYWIKVIKKINDSKFCNGDNDRKWEANFDFFVRPETHHRALEGVYDKCHASFKNEKHQTVMTGIDVKSLLLEPLPE